MTAAPLTLSPDQQVVLDAILAWLKDPARQVLTVGGYAGTGKCLGRGTPVLLFSGDVVPVENVRIGDLLMGPDSTPRLVTSTNSGTGPLYRITPTKGDSWVCNDAHVMTLTGTNSFYRGMVIDVELSTLLSQKEDPSKEWKLFRVPVSWPLQNVPYDPYFIGLWIGDGTREQSHITTADPEVMDYCVQFAKNVGLECTIRKDPRTKAHTCRIRGRGRNVKGLGRHPNALRLYLRNHCQRDQIKFIPLAYLVNDESVRLELLAGIIDSDGYCTKGCYEIASHSRRLADQIAFLARSLGFGVTDSPKVVRGKTYVRMCISGDLTRINVRVPRRKAKPRTQVKRTSVTGWVADPIGIGDYFGFTLSGDGRFLLGDFTVTHNTTILKHLTTHLDAPSPPPDAIAQLDPTDTEDLTYADLMDGPANPSGASSFEVLTPTGKAAHVLRRKGVYASTAHSHLYRAHRDRKTGELHFSLKERDEIHRSLFIVDEASMVDERLHTDLLRHCDKLLYVGDHGQLPPVGKGLNLMASPALRLEKIHRQALGNPLIAFAHHLRGGGMPIPYSRTRTDNDPRLIIGLRPGTPRHGQGVINICATHRTRLNLNAVIRRSLGRKDALEVGDPLICLANNQQLGVFNGMTATVAAVHSLHKTTARVDLTLDDGNLLTQLPLDPRALDCAKLDDIFPKGPPRDSTFWSYAHAVTCHKAQGSEWDTVIVSDEYVPIWPMPQWRYTAATRASTTLIWNP